MSADIDFLPVWKKNATPMEFLQECTLIVGKYPERGFRLVVVALEIIPKTKTEPELMKARIWRHNTDTITTVGLLEYGKTVFLNQDV